MASPSLDKLAVAVYTFLLQRMGYSRVPIAVPQAFILQGLQWRNIPITRDQLRNRLSKLQKQGYIESWTVKHNTHYKKTFFRIPYQNKALEDISIKSDKLKIQNHP